MRISTVVTVLCSDSLLEAEDLAGGWIILLDDRDNAGGNSTTASETKLCATSCRDVLDHRGEGLV